MSYDLQVWSVAPVPLPDALPQRASWQRHHDAWTLEGRGWQLLIGASQRVFPEDIPGEVARQLPGIAYLTELNLSPITAAAARRQQLAKVASALAKAGHGVILDPQTETITTPAGVKRFASPGPSEDASLLTFSWWMARGELVERSEVSTLLDALAATLPEALPRRYGQCEPPEHVYAEMGKAHCVEFMRAHLQAAPVWYAHAPVAEALFAIPPEVGGSLRGFRAAHVSLAVDAEALGQPGWQAGLQAAWRRLSGVLQPFYGDVRTFRGFTRRRGRYWHGPATENHPVCSWWWAGIPGGPTQALVIGEPYPGLWPALRAQVQEENGLYFLSTGNWASPGDVYDRCPPPPAGIVQPLPERGGPHDRRPYPPVWPFGAAYTRG